MGRLRNSIDAGLAGWRNPPSRAIDARDARAGAFYLKQRHGLVHRHVETVTLNSDHTAGWQLTIDLELPPEEEALCGKDGESCRFLFPLVFLRKSDPRAKFSITDNSGARLSVPIQQQCDWISGIAAAEAGNQILRDFKVDAKPFPTGQLAGILRGIPGASPWDASLIHGRLRRYFRTPSQNGQVSPEAIGAAWEAAGLLDVLGLMVEHSLVWVELLGQPGERMTVTVAHDTNLSRRSFVNWSLGEVDPPRFPKLRRWKAKRASDPDWTLRIGDRTFGLKRRIASFRTFGERVAQPLAWMPIEYDFPTVYTRRCESYHFELVCSPGLTPRAFKVRYADPAGQFDGTPDPTPEEEADSTGAPDPAPDKEADSKPPEGWTTLNTRVAHHYRPGSHRGGDLQFQVILGVGAGAFPVLWWLVGAITATLLWILASTHPELKESDREVAAGILLAVPALIAALSITAEDTPVTRLISGARMLLLVTALSSVLAAAVLIGATPFKLEPEWMWTICAIVATAATMPLATGWVLTNKDIWRQMRKLDSADAQYGALGVGIFLAALGMLALLPLSHAPIARGAIAVYLLLMVVAMTALANNRAGIDPNKSRRYVAVSLLAAAIACLGAACVELKAAGGNPTGHEDTAELVALCMLVVSPIVGISLAWWAGKYTPTPDEIHVTPETGRALLAQERILELGRLRQLPRQSTLQANPEQALI